MRKFFALALAVAMVLSLASVSFAAGSVTTEGTGNIVLSKFFKYDADKDIVKDTQAQYGKSYYAMIFEETATTTLAGADIAIDDTIETTLNPITDYSDVEKLRVKAEFEMGEDLVESVSIVKKNFKCSDEGVEEIVFEDAAVTLTATAAGTWDGATSAATDYTFNNTTANYYYFVEIKTKAQTVTGDADIIGTFEFNRKADKKEGLAKIDDCEVDFALNLWYENNYLGEDKEGNSLEITDTAVLKWDDLYVLKFNCDDEIEIEFGKDDINEGTFTVDASGQGKMVVNFNTKANEAIADANPGAKMFFVNFNGAKFNRVGTFEYEMENLTAAYQVVGDKLVEINGLEIDGETAVFNTRTLGNYVFADAELVNPVVEAPVVEAPAAVTNPSTGF
ncbi:MAG: hypothetical protein J5968_06905 [Oscillospiraceae bacterium]|nr:hypothetical protein [Oscillospiraceae bacterium]